MKNLAKRDTLIFIVDDLGDEISSASLIRIIHRYTDTQIHRYTDTQIHRYTDTIKIYYVLNLKEEYKCAQNFVI
jgi:hypothetical protein